MGPARAAVPVPPQPIARSAGPQATRGQGQARLMRPRAGRPLNTLVSTVLSSRAARKAARCGGKVFASGQGRNAVPICTPAAPSANAATIPRAFPIPPVAITGTFTASTTCGKSANRPTWVAISSVKNIPRCPPASSPCAITASQPFASRKRASATVVAEHSSLQPAAFTPATNVASGRP